MKIYDYLLSQINPQEEPSQEEILTTCKNIQNLQVEEVEIIYALILHYTEMECSKGNLRKIPYNGKLFDKNRGVTYLMSNLPTSLKNVICRYVQLVSSG